MFTFEQVSETIKILGLFGSGLWAAWTFQKLQRVRAAELENNQRLSQIRTTQIEHQEVRVRLLRQQPQLAVRLNVTEEASPTDAYKSLLCVSVTLKNEGEQNLRIYFDKSALTVATIGFDKDDRQVIGRAKRYPAPYFKTGEDEPQIFSERIFRAGQMRQLTLAVLPVKEPAVYMLQFHALYEREPYDGEKASRQDTTQIDAIEQTFCVAAGERSARSDAP
jgi:hypothetical protein